RVPGIADVRHPGRRARNALWRGPGRDPAAPRRGAQGPLVVRLRGRSRCRHRQDDGGEVVTALDLDALLGALADLVAERVAQKLSNGNANGHAPVEEPDTLLDAKAAAAKLGVSVRWIYG